jgi:tetratricopeptide (TPR) repeat protein
MQLHGSKWSMNRRTRRSNPWIIIILLLAIAAVAYFNWAVVPTLPPLFVSTPTVTTSPESFVSEAESLVSQGKYSVAIQQYKEAIKVDPTNPSYYLTVAELEIYTSQYEQARQDAGNALILNPNSALAYGLKGWADGFLGNYLDAQSAINQAIQLDATIPQLYSYKAIILSLMVADGSADIGTLDQAIEASRLAIDMSPSALETHWARGLVLELTGNNEDAVTELQAAISQNANISEIHLALGRNYRALQEYDQAVEEFNRANALNPLDPYPLTYIAATYASVGEYAKAIQYAEQAVQVAPSDPYMWGNLGRMYYRNYQYEDAIPAFSLAINGGITRDGVTVKGLPLDYGRVAEYYYTYGLALANLGYCNEALPIAQAVQTIVRNDEIATYNAQAVINLCEQASESGKATPTWFVTATNTPLPTAEPIGTPVFTVTP